MIEKHRNNSSLHEHETQYSYHCMKGMLCLFDNFHYIYGKTSHGFDIKSMYLFWSIIVYKSSGEGIGYNIVVVLPCTKLAQSFKTNAFLYVVSKDYLYQLCIKNN